MRWMVVGLVCVCVGCWVNPSAPAPGEPRNIIGVRSVSQDREFERVAREAAKWDGSIQTSPGKIIGGQSTFETSPRRTVVRSAPAPATSGLSQEVRVLSARVDRLERMVGPGAAAGTPAAKAAPAPKPSLKVYQVSPDGRTAWVSAGTSAGLKQGQMFQVRRGEVIVGKAKLSRAWGDVSELTVLWSNGSVQRGDVVAAVEGAPAAE